MKKEPNISQLATAVMWWLSYISSVRRNYVLSESAIKFPVSEYLEGSILEEDDIELEFTHPKLLRKRFDLFYQLGRSEKNVFEFKYIKNGSTRDKDEKQRVFNDLMRLYLFLERKKNNKSYFLVCGNQRDFISDFQTLLLKPKGTKTGQFIKQTSKRNKPDTSKSEGFYTEWFSFDKNDPTTEIDLTTNNSDYTEIYEAFKIEYEDAYQRKNSKSLKLPDSIKTKLVFLSGNVESQPNLFQPSKIGVWEILRS